MTKEKVLKVINEWINNGDEEDFADKSNNYYLKAIAEGIRFLVENTKSSKSKPSGRSGK